MGVTCRKCKKPLTVPTSVELGLGPVCRHNLKIMERGNTAPLFRSEFSHWFVGDILVMTDDNGPVSLTNDMERALSYLKQIGDLKTEKQTIVYRDSQGIWDGVRIESLSPVQISFYSLNTVKLETALEKVQTKTTQNHDNNNRSTQPV